MLHLLLVEDDKTIGESLQDGLTECGFQVTWLQRGEIAREALAAHSFDLIILDFNLPQVSGLELVQFLRINDTVTPVIMITANDSPEDKQLYLSAGVNKLFGKPFELDALLSSIDALLLAEAS